MTAEQTLELISKQWCSFKDLQELTQLGETNTSRLRNKIKKDLESQGYILPNRLLPMVEVVKYLKIDVDYLENRTKKGE